MTDTQTVLTESQQAYRVIGESLWRSACRAQACSDPVPESFMNLMDAFALSEEKGSVCVQWQEGEEAAFNFHELDILKSKGLLKEKPNTLTTTADPLVPFIFDENGRTKRIYLQRHFEEEREVALKILTLAKQPVLPLNPAVQEALERFNKISYGVPSVTDQQSRMEQQGAVALALQRHFSIITGGPGTGKTTVVAKLLECLLLDNPTLKVALAAPTGKATSRIMQSLIGSCERFANYFPNVLRRIESNSLPARTIHKWLLTRDERGKKPDKNNPLDIDVMIVDEASMIDLRLARQMLNVIDVKRTRLILLGDKYQLSAVGPGSVLADMTATSEALADSVTELTVSHRFTNDSNVGLLAQAIKTAEKPFDTNRFINKFKNAHHGKDRVGIKIYNLKTSVDTTLSKWIEPHLNRYLTALQDYLSEKNALIVDDSKLNTLWQIVESFRVLAAQREGKDSVNSVNNFIEMLIREKTGYPADSLFYPGRLVIIRKNTPSLDVYNGDVGIVIPQDGDPERFDLFIGDRNKRLPVGLLPEHDTAFAMTIHQSQGSQFEHVAVLLPVAEDSPLASRELFYTGVTRAQKEALVFGTVKSIEASILRKTERASGLADRLAGH